ncbi:hypothetical protein [Salmonirosea aquatica]|uniref:Uncharacterized protein n=1 Tax=Salmonirosea aquatica TaxID=2654236 RepID=A0A7C9BB53_9BACT|nr:hypothetical protein [Cytophagaceae bacterium SJW1-29]
MNQTFSFSRFLLLVKAEFAEKGRIQLLTAGLLLVFLLLLMLPITIVKEYGGFLSGLHSLALFMIVYFGGSLYTDLAFSQYGPRDKGMAALMVPSSRLEKFLTPLVLNLIVIVPLMILFLWLHNWTVDYANAKLLEDWNTTKGNNRIPATDISEKYRKIPLSVIQFFTLFYVVIQGVVFLGSLYFTKSSFVKTVTAFILIVLILIMANRGIVLFLLADTSPSGLSAVPFFSWDVVYMIPRYKSFHVAYSDGTENVVYPLLIVIVLILWYITYVRLKEKEI